MTFLCRTALLLALSAVALAQAQPQQPTSVNLKVMLRQEDGTPLHFSRQEAMQIRLEVRDESGGTPKEGTPNQSGEINMSVTGTWPSRSGPPNPVVYTLRVVSPDYEEVNLQNIVPAQQDRIVNISLKRKQPAGEAPPVRPSSTAMVSLARLNVPDKARKELDRGNESLQANDLAKAGEHFRKAIALYPEYDQAYNNLGVVQMQQGDNAGGKANFQKAVELNDHFSRAYTNLGKLAMQEKKFAEADQYLHKALQGDPQNPEALFYAAEAALFIGHFDDCTTAAHALHGIAQHEKYALAHYMSAKALEQMSKPTDAAAEYKLFLKEAPDSPQAPRARAALGALEARATSPQPQP